MGFATYTQTQQEALILAITQVGLLEFANMMSASYLCYGFMETNYSLF